MLIPLRDNVIIAALDDPDTIVLPSGCIISKEDEDLIPYIYNTAAGGATKGKTGYFCMRKTEWWPQRTYVHRVVMMRKCGDSELHVDHINANRFDNRRCNLRYLDARTNATIVRRGETSKYYRVSWNKRRQKWRISIKANGRYSEDFGYYSDEVEAAYWADVWATRLVENPVLNFPDNVNFYKEEALLLDYKPAWTFTPPTLEDLYATASKR